MLCDCHQRLRLPQMSPEMKTVSNADGAVVGLRRRHPHGCTRRSVLSATVWMAGAGGGRGELYSPATKFVLRERSLPKNVRRGLLN